MQFTVKFTELLKIKAAAQTLLFFWSSDLIVRWVLPGLAENVNESWGMLSSILLPIRWIDFIFIVAL